MLVPLRQEVLVPLRQELLVPLRQELLVPLGQELLVPLGRAGHATIFSLCDNDNATTYIGFRDKRQRDKF